LDEFNAEQEEKEKKKQEEKSKRYVVVQERSRDESLVYPTLMDRKESVRGLVPYLTTSVW
jgi:hypothetical protein